MHGSGRTLFAIEETSAPAGLYVTRPNLERVELAMKVGGVEYAVRLAPEQALQLGLALVRDVRERAGEVRAARALADRGRFARGEIGVK